MFSFGSGAISWSSKKQPTLALSSTKAECRSAIIDACEIVWLQKLLSDLGQSLDALLSFIVIISVAYYLLTTRSIMLGQSTLRCTTTLLEKIF
jgi:hypothetical protein